LSNFPYYDDPCLTLFCIDGACVADYAAVETVCPGLGINNEVTFCEEGKCTSSPPCQFNTDCPELPCQSGSCQVGSCAYVHLTDFIYCEEGVLNGWPIDTDIFYPGFCDFGLCWMDEESSCKKYQSNYCGLELFSGCSCDYPACLPSDCCTDAAATCN
jgi:hypothetical protein